MDFKKFLNMFVGLFIVCTITGIYGAEDAEKKGAANSLTVWCNKVTPGQKRAMVAVGASVGAIVVWQAVALPFVMSAIGGYAAEAFVVENSEVRKFAAENSPQCSLWPVAFVKGCGDGVTYYALRSLAGAIWPSLFSSIPVSAGLVAGQLIGIACANPLYRERAIYEWRKVKAIYERRKLYDTATKVNSVSLVPGASNSELAARASGAALSWLVLAGLASRICGS